MSNLPPGCGEADPLAPWNRPAWDGVPDGAECGQCDRCEVPPAWMEPDAKCGWCEACEDWVFLDEDPAALGCTSFRRPGE